MTAWRLQRREDAADQDDYAEGAGRCGTRNFRNPRGKAGDLDTLARWKASLLQHNDP
jgi:hypothetical protein